MSDAPDRSASRSFADELRIRAAEASTQVAAAEVLEDELQASIAVSDLADLRALAARNDVDLDGADVAPGLRSVG